MKDPMNHAAAKALSEWRQGESCKQALEDGVLTPDMDRHLFTAFLAGWQKAIDEAQKVVASGHSDLG